MPHKPPTPCSHPGCPRLSAGRFCEEHAKQDAREYARYRRDPETRKRYGRAWKRIRDRYIAAHPLCEQCQQHGRITPATEVHHIKPLRESNDNSEENLRALCKGCHSAIHLSERMTRRGG